MVSSRLKCRRREGEGGEKLKEKNEICFFVFKYIIFFIFLSHFQSGRVIRTCTSAEMTVTGFVRKSPRTKRKRLVPLWSRRDGKVNIESKTL